MYVSPSRPVPSIRSRAIRHRPVPLDPRLALLDEVGACLAAAPDASRCLDVVAQALVPRLVDACRFELAAAAGSPGWTWGATAWPLQGPGPSLEVPLCARGRILGRLLVWRTDGCWRGSCSSWYGSWTRGPHPDVGSSWTAFFLVGGLKTHAALRSACAQAHALDQAHWKL